MRFKSGIPAVIDQGVHASSQVFSPGRHHPAFSPDGEVLGWEEREAGHVTYAARFRAIFRHRSVGLRCIFDVSDAVVFAPFDQVVVAHLPKEVDSDDRFGIGRSCGFKRSEVNAPIIGLNVHKDRCGSSQ